MLRVVYAIVRLSPGKTMVSLWFRSSMWISSVASISKNTLLLVQLVHMCGLAQTSGGVYTID